MTGEAERKDVEGSFSNAKVSHKILICLAGPVVNIVFGILAFFILSICSGYNISTTISEILPESIQNLDGIQVGDTIKKINNKTIRIKSDIQDALEDYQDGENLEIVVERNGEELTYNCKATKYSEDYDYYILGIKVSLATNTIKDRLYYSFWDTIDFSESIGKSLKMLITGKVGLDQMSGPLGISEMVVDSSGVYDFVYLLALVSLSLGVTNLLPIPALDGGRIFIYIIEGIRGKALNEEVELNIETIGFTLLILLSIYVTYNDILRIF